MTYKKKWSKKRRDTHLRNYNRARYTKIHQILMDLNLLQQLSAFTTKKYASKDYFGILQYASLHNISIKQACLIERFQGKRCPSPEQVMKCCRTTPPELMTKFVNFALKTQFNALPKMIQQQFKKSGILIIDFHQDCYYGNKDNPYVKKSKTKKSTTLFYEYLTADLYCKHGCFTLAFLHRSPRKPIITLINHLLIMVEKVISPKIVLFDGEFATIDIVKLLMHKGVKFLGRKSRSTRVKTHFQTYYAHSNWEKDRKWRFFEMHSRKTREKTVIVDICPQNNHGIMKALIKSPGWPITPHQADILYRKRFNIETGYRDKHKFQLFTCTKYFSTRLLSYLIAILLWNCWQSYLIWTKSLTTFTYDLSREFLVQITANWIAMCLKKVMYP